MLSKKNISPNQKKCDDVILELIKKSEMYICGIDNFKEAKRAKIEGMYQ